MTRVFADTLYWIAQANKQDPWAAPAREARKVLGKAHLVTTDEVLVEFLSAMSGHPERRGRAVKAVRALHQATTVTVVQQSRESFNEGLGLYEQRKDKQYSLTECISMQVMRGQGLTDVLTNDHHFTQEGFRVLIN